MCSSAFDSVMSYEVLWLLASRIHVDGLGLRSRARDSEMGGDRFMAQEM